MTRFIFRIHNSKKAREEELDWQNTLCVYEDDCSSWELEEGCWPGPHGSRLCRQGSSWQPSQQGKGQNFVVQGLEDK